jgi:hypothetical protein
MTPIRADEFLMVRASTSAQIRVIRSLLFLVDNFRGRNAVAATRIHHTIFIFSPRGPA